jgi:hypothetical protein
LWDQRQTTKKTRMAWFGRSSNGAEEEESDSEPEIEQIARLTRELGELLIKAKIPKKESEKIVMNLAHQTHDMGVHMTETELVVEDDGTMHVEPALDQSKAIGTKRTPGMKTPSQPVVLPVVQPVVQQVLQPDGSPFPTIEEYFVREFNKYFASDHPDISIVEIKQVKDAMQAIEDLNSAKLSSQRRKSEKAWIDDLINRRLGGIKGHAAKLHEWYDHTSNRRDAIIAAHAFTVLGTFMFSHRRLMHMYYDPPVAVEFIKRNFTLD